MSLFLVSPIGPRRGTECVHKTAEPFSVKPAKFQRFAILLHDLPIHAMLARCTFLPRLRIRIEAWSKHALRFVLKGYQSLYSMSGCFDDMIASD